MNATEDGDEPVGEAPEYVIITTPPREALTSIPVLGENERQAIEAVRVLHGRVPLYLECDYSGSTDRDVCDGGFESADGEWCCPACTEADGGPTYVCNECRDTDGAQIEYPCATVKTLDTRGL